MKVPSCPSLPSMLTRVQEQSQQYRLANAVRLDNRGPWFLCRSHWTVAQLERRFTEELVGTILYHRVGGILEGEKPYIYMQIALVKSVLQQMHPDSEPEWIEVPTEGDMPENDVQIALKEIRVNIVDVIPDIRDIIRRGRY
jgi:hypothetical protein